MAYFYVKNSLGTRTTGGGLTKQTGSFTALGAANVYATIELAITDGATSGDYICVSDAHALSTATAITHAGPTSGDFLYIVTVDDANCDAQAAVPATPQEQTTGGGDIVLSGSLSYHGLNLKTADDFKPSEAIQLLCFDCVLFYQDNFTASFDGMHIELHNSQLNRADAGSVFRLAGGSSLTMYGGSLDAVGFLTNNLSFGGGGATFQLIGADLSTVTGTLFLDVGGSRAIEDEMDLLVSGCKVDSGMAFLNENFESRNQRLVVNNSSSTSAAAEYQYYVVAYGGSIEDETSIYRDGSTAFPSGTKISLKCVTLASATRAAPFWFDFPTRYAELSATATDTLRIYILSSATLYDSDVWAEVVYPDGTTKQLYNFLSTRHTDIMDTNGTELTTNTEAWTGIGSPQENRYQIDLDTSGDAGADCVPTIRVYVAKASSTIYFCTSIDLTG